MSSTNGFGGPGRLALIHPHGLRVLIQRRDALRHLGPIKWSRGLNGEEHVRRHRVNRCEVCGMVPSL